MRLLLDTHLLLWALGSPSRLSPDVRAQLDAAEVFVSAASIWEISIKTALGKLDADPASVLSALAPAGFALLPVLGEHAVTVARLPPIHRDPFDRMLVAQAVSEPMRLLTRDATLRAYGSLVTVV
jgi:PIN domain nuclease of toxin-antitoxin system